MEFIKLILSDGLGLPSGEDFVNKVFPNIWAFLVQLIAFIIMVFVVIKFAYKPVRKFLDKRREYIANNLKEAEEKNSEANKNIQESITSVNSSKNEAIKIIQDAKKESEIQREKMLEETNAQLQEKRLQAQEDIKKEQEKAIKQVHDDVVSLAYQATKSILEREVNEDDDKKLVDEFVSDLIEKR